jgi:hypothetical protein
MNASGVTEPEIVQWGHFWGHIGGQSKLTLGPWAPITKTPRCSSNHADLREVPDLGAVACVVTSPPYNSRVAYDVHHDAMADEDYRELAWAATGLMAWTL